MSKLDAYQSKFKKFYFNNVDDIIENCILLLKAKQELDKEIFESLKKKLNLTTRVAKAFIKIAKNKVVTKESYYKKLPPHLFTILEICKLKEAQIKNFIDNNKINKTSTRFDILVLRDEAKPINKKSLSSTQQYINLRLSKKNFQLNRLKDFENDLQKLINSYKNTVEVETINYEVLNKFNNKKKDLIDEIKFSLSKAVKENKEKKEINDLFNTFKQRLENLGKDTVEESKKIFNTC